MSTLSLRSVIGGLALGLVLSVMSAPTPGVAAEVDETAPQVTGLTFSASSYRRNDEIVAQVQVSEPVASAVVLLRDARGEDRYLFADPTDPEDAADPDDALSRATVAYDWPTGALEVREVRVFDAAGNGSTYHRDGTVTVEEGHPTRYASRQHGLLLPLKDLALDGNDDLSAPVLRGVRLLSPTTARPGDVLSAEIDVEVPGDLLSGYVFLQDAAGRQRTLRTSSRDTRTTATATVDETWADGPATLTSVLVYDSEGNSATYYRDGRLQQNRLPVQQHDLQLTADPVIDNPAADGTPPVLRSVSLRSAGPFAVGDRLHLDVDVEDEHTVRVEVEVTLDGYVSTGFGTGLTLPPGELVQPSTTTGVRRINAVRLTDEAGNSTLWFNNGSAPITSPHVEVGRPTVGITTWCVGPCLPPATAPRELAVEARGPSEAWVTWRAPADDGGSAILDYAVTTPGGQRCTAERDGCLLTDLEGGADVPVSVAARNGLGTGPAATTTHTTAPRAPDAPPGVQVGFEIGEARVSWQPARANGGGTLLYTAWTQSGQYCQTTGTGCVIRGLAENAFASVTVVATSLNGSASAAPVNGIVRATPRAWAGGLPYVNQTGAVTYAFAGMGSNEGPLAVPRFDVRVRKAGPTGDLGAWTYPMTWQDRTTRQVVSPLPPGTTACFSARYQEVRGDVSAWTEPSCVSAPLDDRRLAASAGWSRSTFTPAYATTLTHTSRTGATLTAPRATIGRLWLLAAQCPTCGQVGVYVDGVLMARFDLAAPTTRARRLLPVVANLRPVRGTVVVRPLGGGRVPVDGLVISPVGAA